MKRLVSLLALILAAPIMVMAASDVQIKQPEAGSVNESDGLAAWARVYEVASHPRCSNCHVGKDNYPMWSGPSYGKTRRHGMNINAGDSRIGAEFLMCQTCHSTKATDWDNANRVAHAAPRVAMGWRLAPVEAEWFGKSSSQVCNQLRDPARNGGRKPLDIAKHLDHDLILHWAWKPGGGREPAPHSLQQHIDDVLAWGTAGMPCPK